MKIRSFRSLLAAVLPGLALASFLPAQEPQPAKPEEPKVFSARHILIAWKGSQNAPAEIQLTKEEAKKKADEILAKLKEGGDFAALAKQASICPSSADGGYLGQWQQGMMIPEFEKGLVAVKDGELTPPIETEYGYHIVQRLAVKVVWPREIAASHILIAYKGARRADEKVTRTRDEALALAKEVRAKIAEGKLTFEKAAEESSDDPGSKTRGGDLGTFPCSGFAAPFVDAAVALADGQVSEPVETGFGIHIIRRNKTEQPMRASHILVPWKGCPSAPADVARSKEEAEKLCQELVEKIGKGEDFAALAKQHSTCPSSAQGGDLGPFAKGRMVKPFEDAVAGAKVGDVVGPVETRFGYHVIKRTQ